MLTSSAATLSVPAGRAAQVVIVAMPFDWVALASFALAVAAFAGTTYLTLRGWRKASEASASLQRQQLRLEMERLVYLDAAKALDSLFTALAGAQAYAWGALQKLKAGQKATVECIDPARSALVRLVGEPDEALTGSEGLTVWRTPLGDYSLVRPEVAPVRDQLSAQVTPLAAQANHAVAVLDEAKSGQASSTEIVDALEPLMGSLENWRVAIGHLDSTLRSSYVASLWDRPSVLPEPTNEGPHVVVTPDGWRIEGELTIS